LYRFDVAPVAPSRDSFERCRKCVVKIWSSPHKRAGSRLGPAVHKKHASFVRRIAGTWSFSTTARPTSDTRSREAEVVNALHTPQPAVAVTFARRPLVSWRNAERTDTCSVHFARVERQDSFASSGHRLRPPGKSRCALCDAIRDAKSTVHSGDAVAGIQM
jgi:hypothetical protein